MKCYSLTVKFLYQINVVIYRVLPNDSNEPGDTIIRRNIIYSSDNSALGRHFEKYIFKHFCSIVSIILILGTIYESVIYIISHFI